MKIRNDFVTNSSSSSFIVINLDSQTLSAIINRFNEELEKMLWANYFLGLLNHVNNSVSIVMDETYYDEEPKSMLDVLNAFLYLFADYEEDYLQISKNEDENKDVDLSEFESNEASIDKRLIGEIFKYRNEILDDMTMAELTVADIGWGGDSDLRYDPTSFGKRRLKEIYKKIATEKGCSPSDVTDDDFFDYVSNRSSISEIKYTFLRIDDKVKRKISKDFYVSK